MGEVKVEKFGSRIAMCGDVEAVSLSLDVEKLLELQDKYTRLQMECRRLYEFIQAKKRGFCDVLFEFSDEYLNMTANIINSEYLPLTNEEWQAKLKELREFAERSKGGEK